MLHYITDIINNESWESFVHSVHYLYISSMRKFAKWHSGTRLPLTKRKHLRFRVWPKAETMPQ